MPERDFALSELKLLVDAVQAARFLSEKESMALIRKLAALSSAHEAELLRREVVVTGRAKSGSEDVCRNVDTLHAAIAGNSRITFRYFDWDLQGRRRFRPKTYEASPIALCWEDGELLSRGLRRAARPDALPRGQDDGDHGDGRPGARATTRRAPLTRPSIPSRCSHVRGSSAA